MLRRLLLSHRVPAALLLATALAVAGGAPAVAADREGVVRGDGAPGTVPGSYLVILKSRALKADSGSELAARYHGKLRRSFDAAFHGYSVELDSRQARRLAADPAVASVVPNRRVRLDATATQTEPPSWGLDRIDRRRLPLDKQYTYPDTAGQGVTAYIVDTGVMIEHHDFGGRASYGYDAIDGDNVADDGYGHGTHVAATVAGTLHGVAKQAKVVAVRVLDDSGSGTTEQVVAGIDWVTSHAVKPAVVNMSLGGDPDEALDTAVRNSIASGLTYTVAAGNSGVDASEHSPARVATALTVGASTSSDSRASYSNYGPLVDLFAPGSDIVSAATWWEDGETSMSGTSMAAPHVAGAAALYLASHRTATPAQVATALTGSAVTGSLHDLGEGSPDRLLYTGTAPLRPPGPRFTNTTDQITDDGPITSPVTVTGVTGRAPADLEVELDIKHGWSGDLRVELIAPDGTVYLVKEEDIADGTDGLTGIYGIDASSETANGVWRLRVTDVLQIFSGYLDSWTLRF
ncbi:MULTISPECIES: S8 family peptidase [unclassified Kitasatospora]|uniref:S8 family peptidase n=1 Tax=unclassified Kitasatospora TaxID=2633591 RepID=UPI00070EBBAF|nr:MULTISPECIES: S8 family peptidase [unclassified Kitasatospora]KQV14817.1 serine protease [Kitasatospora sp. Root107]KRB68173.1 serine protease [Kitasatospora sp. Root187]